MKITEAQCRAALDESPDAEWLPGLGQWRISGAWYDDGSALKIAELCLLTRQPLTAIGMTDIFLNLARRIDDLENGLKPVVTEQPKLPLAESDPFTDPGPRGKERAYEVWYLATCQDCAPDGSPQPFTNPYDRDVWASAHTSATGHRVAVSDSRIPRRS